jgi:hypothetical protein
VGKGENVALEETFADLVAKWRQLHEAAQALRITAVEDQPAEGAVLLIERCADAAEDLLGWATLGLAAAGDAQQGVGVIPNVARARHSLRMGQQHFGRLDDQFFVFASYEWVSELVRFGRKRRGEWLAWVHSMREAISQCREPIQQVRDALVNCWDGLAEHSGTSVSVQSTNIGQQISTAGAALNEETRDALT